MECYTSSIERKILKINWKRNSQTRIGSIAYFGSIKTRFEICKDENEELIYIRAIEGHSGGMIITPRLMNDVLIPYLWKQLIYHVGRARDQCSVAEAGLVAGGEERKEGRQTIFFTPLDPFNSDAVDAEITADLKKPRKVKYQIH